MDARWGYDLWSDPIKNGYSIKVYNMDKAAWDEHLYKNLHIYRDALFGLGVLEYSKECRVNSNIRRFIFGTTLKPHIRLYIRMVDDPLAIKMLAIKMLMQLVNSK